MKTKKTPDRGDLTPKMIIVLDFIRDHPNCLLKTIFDNVEITYSHLYKIIFLMEKNKLIRYDRETGRKIYIVSCTEKGCDYVGLVRSAKTMLK